MKSEMKIGLVVCAAMLTAGGAFAQATRYWKSPVDGLYTDDLNWSNDTAPADPGDKGTFNVGGTYTVTFPLDFTNDLTRTEANFNNGKITFNSRGTSWVKPTSPNAILPSDNTFKIANGGHSFNLESTGDSGGNNLLQFGLIDGVLSAEMTSDSIHTRLESGMFNIYDATGSTDSGTRLVVSHAWDRKHYVTFKEGSESRIRQIDFRCNGPENVFTIEGGSHTVFGNFNVTHYNNDHNYENGWVRCLGGSLDVRNQFNIGGKSNTIGRLVVDGGDVKAQSLRTGTDRCARSEVTVSNGVLTANVLEVAQQATSDAAFTQYGGEVLVPGYAYLGYQGTGIVEVAGGTWEGRSETSVGRNDNSYGQFTLSGGTFLLTNSTLRVASASLSKGDLLITGGQHKIREITVGPDGGTGYADISGGAVDASYFVVGNGQNGTNGLFRISGGKHVVYDIAVGRTGLGYFEMTGGEVDCTGYIRLGYGGANFAGYDKSNTNRISTLRMTGGTLRVLNSFPVNVSDSSDNSSRLALDGGTLVSRYVRGWNGSAAKGGNGYAELTADGGRVVPVPDNTSDIFMETFDLALLGDAGLTVDTEGRSARINQVFKPKAGATGRFIKAGIGTLYLNGQSEIGNLDVIGGTLAFVDGNVFTGHLAVTNGATASLQENGVTGLTLERLTLGDATSTGRLMMDNADTITITTQGGLHAVNGRILLTSPSANGAYTLFRCAGTVTLQDIEKLDISNSGVDKEYAWSLNPGQNDTEVILTISDRVPSAPVIWDGTLDSQWNNTANWLSPLPPAKGQSARFPGAAARKAISVTAGATAGEMDFQSAAGYTLSGEALTLDNDARAGFISASQGGTNLIAAPLVLKRLTALDISEGSALVVDTVKGDGAIQKGGLGLVVLNGSEDFMGGFTVQEGTLALTSAAAFGMPSQENDRWALAGGTLRYDGPTATRDNSISVLASATDGSTVFDVVDNELTLNGNQTVTKGALIKRGAGTLTFNVNGPGSILTAGNGKVPGNGSPPDFTITFPDSGLAPASGYAGFNVAEGTVRLTSPNASSLVNMKNAIAIGLKTLHGTVSPRLEINHCQVDQVQGSYHCFIGARTMSGSALTSPALHVVNGAYLRTDTFQFGNDSGGTVNPELLVDDSSVWVSYAINVNQGNGGTTSITLTNKATLTVNGNNLNVNRPVNFVADDSQFLLNTVAANDGLVRFTSNAQGTFTLRNNARMRYAHVRVENSQPLHFLFDNATLEPTLTNAVFAFRGDNTRHTVELSGRGVTFNIPNGQTNTIGRNMTGSGEFHKAGPGQLIFAGLLEEADVNGTLEYTPLGAPIDGYTGGTWVDAGTLVVSNGAVRTDSRITVAQGATLDLTDLSAIGTLAGTGTVTGGALTQGTLSPGMADGDTGSLTLDGTTLAGVTFACDVMQDVDKTILASDKLLNVGTASSVIVDFGRTNLDPLLTPCSVVIGTYGDLQNPPDVATWKVRNVGASGTIGQVEAANGLITVTVRFGGFLLMIR